MQVCLQYSAIDYPRGLGWVAFIVERARVHAAWHTRVVDKCELLRCDFVADLMEGVAGVEWLLEEVARALRA